jgi:D-glycero-D-manno-heptose 1,7-bisphosphate phosphatase
MSPQALFLDRDGTLIVDRHYLSDPADVALLPGVRETLHQFAAGGCRLFLFTNQSGVGRGMFSLEAVHRCNLRMLELLGLPSPGFTESCIATEVTEMPGGYRKPSPRFILEMMTKYSLMPAKTWMIGDRLNDMQGGLNAGVRTAILTQGKAAPVPSGVWQCCDLPDFHAKLLKVEAA